MKQVSIILILLVALGVFVTSVQAEDPVKYEVTFTVTYNSLNPFEAAGIIRELMIDHLDACKVEIETRKVNDSLFWDGGAVLSISADGYLIAE